MRINENDFQQFERVDKTPPTYPKRSYLYQISPIATKTENVESFTGYLNRIAYEYCVSVRQIIKTSFYKSRGYWKNYAACYSRSLNGLNYDSNLVMGVIKEATFIDEVIYTNLLPFRNIISSDHLLRSNQFWCPGCINDDVKENGIAYERLIWNLEIVEVCSIHQTVLTSTCYHCKKNNQYQYCIPYGFCKYCRNWLGYYIQKSSISDKKENITKSMWIEKEIRKLLKSLPVAETIFQKENFLKGLFSIIMSQTGGNVSRFCQRVNLVDFDFVSLFIEGNLISLRKLISICYPLNISLVDLLSGKIPEKYIDHTSTNFNDYSEKDITEKYYEMFVERHLHKSEKTNNETIERAKLIMKDLLNQEPMSFSEVCKIVGIRGRVLLQKLPLLSLQLKTRFKASKKGRRLPEELFL